jgi:hypothetical protein
MFRGLPLSQTHEIVSEPIVYLAHECPDVEVLWEGVWCPGELRMREAGSQQ